ncbi:MAG: COX15/CtaA family protein [Thermoplasmata archaeon]|nr:COX15/CtaA family protein [Thermoplasmata archaeon]
MTDPRGRDLFRWSAIAAFLSCYATILLGGEVIASDAGLGCPDWPSCHGTFAPPLVGATAVEWSHRLGAATLTLFVTVLFIAALLFERRRPILVRLASVAFSAVLVEALLGGIVVESQLAIWLVILHFAVATVLLGFLALIVLLGNLPHLPKRWLDWAREASTDRPEPGPSRPQPAGPNPGRPSPGDGPFSGSAGPGPGL